MLFRIGPDAGDARSVIAQSKDHIDLSAGATTASWTQVRKVPGSHGLCNPGGPLAASMDPCVANICAVDGYCCNVYWDGICMNEVASNLRTFLRGPHVRHSDVPPGVLERRLRRHSNEELLLQLRDEPSHGFIREARKSVGPGSRRTPLRHTVAHRALQADGLIPTTLAAGCPDNRALIALLLDPSDRPDYHFLRRDSNGHWSHKNGFSMATDKDVQNADILNAETAYMYPYTLFGAISARAQAQPRAPGIRSSTDTDVCAGDET